MNLLQGKWPRLATLLAVLVAAALVFLAWERYTRTPWTRDARVRADVVTLSADVSGLITRLPLSDNQPVEKGGCCSASIRRAMNWRCCAPSAR